MGKSKSVQCRFCLEDDIRRNLISPCLCKGSFKFVHNNCLIKWYNHEPLKALQCSVCLETFSKVLIHPLEDLEIYKPYLHLILQKPLFSVLLWNWIYFSVYTNFNNLSIANFQISYSIYQLFLHVVSFSYFIGLLSNVKNKTTYFSIWKDKSRIIILPIHLILFLGIPKTTWIGGMASDVFLFLYFYEHIDILAKINEKHNFAFTSRTRRPIE
jgi:hypothetical protein